MSEAVREVIPPQELVEWPWIHRLLSEALQLFEQGQLGFQDLCRAAQLAQGADSSQKLPRASSDEQRTSVQEPTPGDLVVAVFANLERFVLTQCNPQTRYRILTLTLPTVIRYALAVVGLDVNQRLSAQLTDQGSDCSLSVRQFSSLLACGVLGLLRSPGMVCRSILGSFSSQNILGDLSRPEHYDRLQSVFRFFDAVADSNKAMGNIHFIHRKGLQLDEIRPADWLQCDTPLCPIKVQCTPQSCQSCVTNGEVIIYPVGQKQCGYCPEMEVSHKITEAGRTGSERPSVYSHQILMNGSMDVVVSSVSCPQVSAPSLGLTELERCQLQTFRLVSELLASLSAPPCDEAHPAVCCADFVGGGRGEVQSMETDSYDMSSRLSSVPDSSAGPWPHNENVSSQLLAFSQQLSENILNEALQITTHRGSTATGTRPKVPRLSPRHQHSEDSNHGTRVAVPRQSNIPLATPQPVSSKSGAVCTPTVRHPIVPEPRRDFVDIPVELEFGDSVEVDGRNGVGPPPFKKILLVEESDESEEPRFTRHSVVGECIVEESSRDPSPSDSSVDSSSCPVSPDNVIKVSEDVPMVADVSEESASGLTETQEGSGVEMSMLHSFANDFVSNLIPGVQSPADRSTSNELSESVLHGVLTGVGLPNQSLGAMSDVMEHANSGRLLAAQSGSAEGDGSEEHVVESMDTQEIEKSSPEYFRSAVEDMVDSMLSLAFRNSYKEIEKKLDVEASNLVRDNNRTSAVETYVSGLVDDTFEEAMYKIREYIAEISRPEGCRSVRVMGGLYLSDKALDREWNAQLTAFVDDFVMNVMEEALYISKTQNPEVRRKDRRMHTCRSTDSSYSRVPSIQEQTESDDSLPVPPLSQAIGPARLDQDSKYFEVEFAVDFHNSRLGDTRRGSGASSRGYLRADHSSGSSRRGSNEDDNIRLGWRRSSTGFRDSVLSEFEDELVHSDISTPSLNMFGGTASSADTGTVQSKRRASEPTGRRRVSSDFQTKLDKKRARSVDSTASRKVILQWLDGQSSSSSSNLSASSRKRTSSSHLDWFAQDLLVEAFNDAFVTLFGRNYEGLSEHEEVDPSASQAGTITHSVVQFAESISRAILEESYHEVVSQTVRAGSESIPDEFYSVTDSQDEYMDALDVPLSQLENVAETFSAQILKEAINIVKDDFHRYTQTCLLYIMQDTQMQVLMRWAGATRAGCPGLVCCTLGSSQLKQLWSVVTLIQGHRYSVADLLHLMFTYLEEKSESVTEETPFAYIVSRLGDV